MRLSTLSLSGRTGCAAVLASLALLGCSSSDKATTKEPGGTGGAGAEGGASGTGSATAAGGQSGVDSGLPASAADWPMYAHDQSSNYWNRAETKISVTSAPNLTQAWVFDTGGMVTGTPAIVGGRVYLGSTGVFALDLVTGTQIWKNANVSTYSSPAVEDGVVYIHDSGSAVHALNATDGTEI
jgi:outer membrane protein assembly factor BamB